MKIKIVLSVVLAGGVAGFLVVRHQMARAPKPPASQAVKSAANGIETNPLAKSARGPTRPPAPPSDTVSSLPRPTPFAPAKQPERPTNALPPTVPVPSAQALTYNGYKVEDPAARVALYFVGTGDLEANAYWENAIFDPSLPAEERKDLIEDLNETGMADPQHPSPQDLPMIVARIRIIQQLAPYSIDQVDANAFAEAYNDLIGMANGQTPQ